VRRLLRESSLTSPQRSNGLNANCWASRARNRQPVMGGRGGAIIAFLIRSDPALDAPDL
jgi:hypothetical protein